MKHLLCNLFFCLFIWLPMVCLADGTYRIGQDKGGVYFETNNDGGWYIEKSDLKYFKPGQSGIYSIGKDRNGTFIVIDSGRRFYLENGVLPGPKAQKGRSESRIKLSDRMAAGDYVVNITRSDFNMYKITSSGLMIVTKSCHERPRRNKAVLSMDGLSGTLLFESGEECDVKGVYRQATIANGKYQVAMSYESENWFKVLGQNLFIRTMACANPCMGEEAVLHAYGGGVGAIIFQDDNDECSVDGIFSQIKFQR
jgi:hypothetical protein